MRRAPLACSASERRLAFRYAGVFRATGRTVIVEALWVRPARAWALAAGASTGVAASVLSVDRPAAGLAVAALALGLALAELGPIPILRRLTFARATQYVLSAAGPPKPVTLILVPLAAGSTPRSALSPPRPSARRTRRSSRAPWGWRASRATQPCRPAGP